MLGAADASTAFLRRHLARELRRLREDQARMSLEEAAWKVRWARTTLWHVECGDVLPRPREVSALCALYGAEEHTTACLVAIATHTQVGPWPKNDHINGPRTLDTYRELREYADRIVEYQRTLVPTLLQTRAYARIQLAETVTDPDQLDQQVNARLNEAALLTRTDPEPPRLSVVLDEAVLRQFPQRPDVMAEQRYHLAQLSELPNVSIRVVPFAGGPYPGLLLPSGGFTVLNFPDHHKHDTIHPPRFTATGEPDDQTEGQWYLEAFDGLLTFALDEEATRDLLLGPALGHGGRSHDPRQNGMDSTNTCTQCSCHTVPS